MILVHILLLPPCYPLLISIQDGSQEVQRGSEIIPPGRMKFQLNWQQ